MRPHSWDPKRSSAEIEILHKHARALPVVRDIPTQVDAAFKSVPAEETPYAVYLEEVVREIGPNGEWGESAPRSSLKNHAFSLIVFAVDCLASSAELVTSGSYLFGIHPVARASTEASVALASIVAVDLPTRERAVRHAMIVRASAREGAKNSLEAAHASDFNNELQEFDSLLRHLVGEDQLKISKHAELLNADGVKPLSVRRQFREFGEEIGVEAYDNVYGTLSQLAHPTPRRIEAIMTCLPSEQIVESVLSVLHVQLGCLTVAFNRMAHFFGVKDELSKSQDLLVGLGDAIRNTRLELQEDA